MAPFCWASAYSMLHRSAINGFGNLEKIGKKAKYVDVLEPVIKLTPNPRTVRTTRQHIDFDCSGILRREINFDQAGEILRCGPVTVV